MILSIPVRISSLWGHLGIDHPGGACNNTSDPSSTGQTVWDCLGYNSSQPKTPTA
jgi:hypothetical protein